MIRSWKSKAPHAVANHRIVDQNRRARTVPRKASFRASETAAAACWANTVCSPSAGIIIRFMTCNSVPNRPYSAAGIHGAKI